MDERTEPAASTDAWAEPAADAPAGAPAAFVVAYVVGVTPGKWARVWGERMPRHPLELRALGPDQALAALDNGT
ncbi:MAG: LysR family transcriptional regulator, partial [Rhodoglobus sp.]